jgi:hypothetical protein
MLKRPRRNFLEVAMPKKKSAKKTAKKKKPAKKNKPAAAKAKAKPEKKTAPVNAKKEKGAKRKKIDFDDEPETDVDEDMDAEDAHEVDEVGVEPAYGDKSDEY